MIPCALVVSSLAGCGADPPVQIGAKDFAEQRVLAAMAAELLRDRGIDVAPVVTCRDTFAAQRMLRIGRVDLMAEYSGTRWLFVKGPVPPGEDDLLDAVRRLDEPIGLRWQDALGFDNRFVVLVTADRAGAFGLESIGDLAELPGPVRVGCPPEYVRRPLDGLGRLADAYGLTLADPTLVEPDVRRRFDALLDGRVDAAIGYATDGVIDRLGLRVLEDPRGFFPSYEAAFVVREEIVEARPEVVAALRPLEGALTVEAMRGLVDAVDLEGRPPAEVAREFLRDRDLLTDRGGVAERRPALVVTEAEGDDLGTLDDSALLAAREAFPDRPVRLERTEDPALEVNRGAARLAVLGAERFFRFRGDGPPERLDDLQAAAVVGTRHVHVIRRDDADDPLAGTVGVSPDQSGGGIAARRLLEGRAPSLEAPIDAMLAAVAAGEVDAAILLVEAGDPRVAGALAESEGRLRLASLGDWLTPERAAANPFLRGGAIAAGIYGSAVPVETLAAQVVLAGAAEERRELAAGPGAALPVGGVPLTPEQVEALADAGATSAVAPDPALPSAWGLVEPEPEVSLAESIWLTATNLLALAFLGWLVTEVRRPATAPAS